LSYLNSKANRQSASSTSHLQYICLQASLSAETTEYKILKSVY